MTKYILETWPDIQKYMLHPRWSECIFCTEIEGHPCLDSTYMIPEDLYEEINNPKDISCWSITYCDYSPYIDDKSILLKKCKRLTP